MDIEFISSKALEKEKDKVNYILKNLAKKEKVLVLQCSLTAEEEKTLIAETMNMIDEEFQGIEISTMSTQEHSSWKKKLLEILGVKNHGLTIVGPANIVKKIKKNPEIVKISLSD
ncbi:MAG: DUF2073 domain-containing protein [Candidatus Micrarchaeota archaeon]|nr:DUF2073 domain-containing protein [Candidatus Micrarchaeota archaeon]